MEITADTPKSLATISGQELQVAAPFLAGHTCTENEASALNQLLKENVRNNCAKRVKEALDQGKDPQAIIDEYTAGYEFGVRASGRLPSDPVEREAWKMAQEKVKDALKKKGYKLKDIGADKMDKLIDDVLGKYPQLMDQAKKIVAARGKAEADIEIEV